MRFAVSVIGEDGTEVLQSERVTLDTVTAGLWLSTQMQEAVAGCRIQLYALNDGDPLPAGWPSSAISIPVASALALGLVRVGAGLAIDSNGVLSVTGSSVFVPDPDAAALFAGIAAAGDTLPAGWEQAWNTFVLAAKSAGYWSRFTLLAPMLSSGLAGAFVAYVNGAVANMTNHGFVQGDYSQSTGVTTQFATGAYDVTKYVDTGMTDGAGGVGTLDCAIGYVQGNPVSSGNNVGAAIGSGNLIASCFCDETGGFTSFTGAAFLGSVAPTAGMFLASRNGPDLTEYHNGTPVNTGNLSGTQTFNGTVYLFCFHDSNGSGNPAVGGSGNFTAFFVGHNFTDAEAAQFHTDYAALYATIGRAI